jgi:hypothetical protein
LVRALKGSLGNLNTCSELLGERFFLLRIDPWQQKLGEDTMRKIVISLAALGVLGIAVPYAAPAMAEETVIMHRHGEGLMHRHGEGLMHRHSDRTILIRHRDHDHDRGFGRDRY